MQLLTLINFEIDFFCFTVMEPYQQIKEKITTDSTKDLKKRVNRVLSTLNFASFLSQYRRCWPFLLSKLVFDSKHNLSSIMDHKYLYSVTTSISWPFILVLSVLVPLCLKSIRMSLVLKGFSSRKVSWHHVTKWSMTGLCEVSSLFSKLTITVSKLHKVSVFSHRATVISVQNVEEGGKNSPLWWASWCEGQIREMAIYSHSLGSICEEV